ncbi:MoxR family ATPase [Nocardiopsis sp. CC223A]|uniref:MoxR family ATPase n=1 Tax=Nocardiopsis sp. CC223A TaxID=3044051 RepID=UPI00278C352C|nr:MoxR family ATPase [Nocardiopsis sp. CC223A]
MRETTKSWKIFTGSRKPDSDKIAIRLPDPPPWRNFHAEHPIDNERYFQSLNRTALRNAAGDSTSQKGEATPSRHSARSYDASPETVDQVNTALYLRRPLLVTGPPGSGKSTLAEAVAYELSLGPVLHWPITSRSTLADGLYRYDPIGRLYTANHRSRRSSEETPPEVEDIGDHIRLGPLGTALLPFRRPRVLLIDEVDKSDIDLPNDLLNIFERGYYEIPELMRADPEPPASSEGKEKGRSCDGEDVPASGVQVMTADGSLTTTIRGGRVQCQAFPLVIMTSNGERAFPPAFLRRCIRLSLELPEDEDKLYTILKNHFSDATPSKRDAAGLIARFLEQHRSDGQVATDQLLNTVFMHTQMSQADAETRGRMADRLLQSLTDSEE